MKIFILKHLSNNEIIIIEIKKKKKEKLISISAANACSRDIKIKGSPLI